jgi:hypothetical protein
MIFTKKEEEKRLVCPVVGKYSLWAMSLSEGISCRFCFNITPTLKGVLPISIKIYDLFIEIDTFPFRVRVTLRFI